MTENNTKVSKKKLTSRLGDIEYSDGDLLVFKDGLYGFETYKEYVLWDDERYRPFKWLVCVDNPDIVFTIIRAEEIVSDYHPRINGADSYTYTVFIITIGKDIESVTANLRAPVLISEEKGKAKQEILTDTNYPLHYKINK